MMIMQKADNDFGKYESWYIIDALPNASLVAGTNISNQEIIKKALKNGTLDQYLQKWPVKKVIILSFLKV